MAVSADPSGNPSNGRAGGGGGATAGNPSNGTASPSGATAQALKHDPGLSAEWTAEEQVLLDELLTKYASEPVLIRYAKVAKQLKEKSVRDVALRCRWMTILDARGLSLLSQKSRSADLTLLYSESLGARTADRPIDPEPKLGEDNEEVLVDKSVHASSRKKKESGKRRKDDLTRKNKDKKDRAADSSPKPPAHLTARPNVPPYVLPMLQVDNDDDISYKEIGGVTGQLLEHNSQVFNQISTNLANYKIQDNVGLFCQTRDNIFKLLNDMNDMPEIMKQMPPLPVKVNDELAASILPRGNMPIQ